MCFQLTLFPPAPGFGGIFHVVSCTVELHIWTPLLFGNLHSVANRVRTLHLRENEKVQKTVFACSYVLRSNLLGKKGRKSQNLKKKQNSLFHFVLMLTVLRNWKTTLKLLAPPASVYKCVILCTGVPPARPMPYTNCVLDYCWGTINDNALQM